MSAVELGTLFNVCDFGASFAKPDQKLLTDLGVGHLTAAEAHSDLDAIAFLEELHRVSHLDVQVVRVDAGRHANLLDLDDALILLGFLFLLELVEAELAVVHDLADRRDGVRRDLHEIKLLFLGHGQRRFGRDDTEHGSVGSDQADFLVADFFVELMI